MKSCLLGALSASILLLLSTAPSAALVGNGGGLIYDDVLDITWAQPDIGNYWDNANTWASGLTLGGVSGWRLPYISVAAGAGPLGFTPGPVDCNTATELACRDNEFGYMFYHNLSGTQGRSILTSGDPDLALFPSLQSLGYWSGTEFSSQDAWFFHFFLGGQDFISKNSYSNCLPSWAVHAGNITAVIPGPVTPGPVDFSGTVQNEGGTGLCGLVLASGKFMFSCNPNGPFSLTDLPRESDGTVKRQVYADGFFPSVGTLQQGCGDKAVVMRPADTCPSYNTPYQPGVFPDSAGKQINISGQVRAQNTQTPVCAMVLANGQGMFSCDGSGSYALNIPLDTNGQFKLQVYADGFAPTIQTFDEFSPSNDVRMARFSWTFFGCASDPTLAQQC